MSKGDVLKYSISESKDLIKICEIFVKTFIKPCVKDSLSSLPLCLYDNL